MTPNGGFVARVRAAWRALFATTVITPPAPAPMHISDQALWEASRFGDPEFDLKEVFTRFKPMPGVVPRAVAMDTSLPAAANDIANWAANGVAHEGLQFLGYPYLAQLAQRAEYRKIAEIWAEHSTRKWIKLTGPDDKVNAVEAELKRLNVRSIFREAAEHDGLFGRSQIFMDFDDADRPRELEARLMVDDRKINKNRPLQRLKNVEPMWSYPGPYNTSNPLAANFYKPAGWYVYGKTVHDSRMLTFVGREVPDLLKPAYAFGGLAMTQMAKPYVDNWLRTRQSVSDLIHAFSTMVLATNTDGLLTGGGAASLWSRASIFTKARDNRGLMIIDKNEEALENVSVPLSGLDDLQAQAQEQMSAVSGIPLVILLGVTPSGLNASSDGEVRSFYAAVKAYQEKTFGPNLHTLLQVVQLSLFGAVDDSIAFEFEDLWEMSEKEKAEIRTADATADKAYIDAGVVDPEETRDRLRNDETSLYHGVDLSGPAPEPEEEEVKPVLKVA